MLDKKSAIYSERPILPMGGELIGWKNTLPLVRYGSTFRQYRKYFHQTMGTPTAVAALEPLGELKARQLLRRIVDKPEDFVTYIRTSVAVDLASSFRAPD